MKFFALLLLTLLSVSSAPVRLNKQRQLELSSEAQSTYFIERSDDLSDWHYDGDYHIGDGTTVTYEMEGAPTKAFYRVTTLETNEDSPEDADGDLIPNA